MHDSGQPDPPFTQFASIGTGFSAIGLGATLQRWYGLDDIQFFDRQSDLGGTWFANSYPGEPENMTPKAFHLCPGVIALDTVFAGLVTH